MAIFAVESCVPKTIKVVTHIKFSKPIDTLIELIEAIGHCFSLFIFL